MSPLHATNVRAPWPRLAPCGREFPRASSPSMASESCSHLTAPAAEESAGCSHRLGVRSQDLQHADKPRIGRSGGMPPYEPCPHYRELILDWHNEWYNATERKAIYGGHAAMDCPLCRKVVIWFEARDIGIPPTNAQPPVYQRSAILAAQWVP